jgi:hypothetical protein
MNECELILHHRSVVFALLFRGQWGPSVGVVNVDTAWPMCHWASLLVAGKSVADLGMDLNFSSEFTQGIPGHRGWGYNNWGLHHSRLETNFGWMRLLKMFFFEGSKQSTHIQSTYPWLVGGLEDVLFSISYMDCHRSHWRTHMFQAGDCTTNQILLTIINHIMTI